MDTFRVRLNCIDHYQAVPSDEFDPPVPRSAARQHAKDRPRVSVLRVFGATDTGQKVLMHVHGAFHYTYIEYSGSLVPEDVDIAINALHSSVDHALAVSYRVNPYDGKHKYVAHISLVKGVPFYGFHVGYKFYLKIYLLNPLHMTRLADLLREGAVMKRVLQPYESHLQYVAQWMCDYNLYGCAYIDCAHVKFRGPVPRYVDMANHLHQWHDRSILPEHISDQFLLPKQSHCALEVDVCTQDILNRNAVEPRFIHHDFIERLNPIPEGAKLVQSMAGLWKDETRRRQMRMGIKDPANSPFPPDVLVAMSADLRNEDAAGWIHEQEFREKVSQIAAEEHRSSSEGPDVAFDTFVNPVPLEPSVQTALESVEDFYPHRIHRLTTGRTQNDLVDNHQVLVDGDTVHGSAHEDNDAEAETAVNCLSESDESASNPALPNDSASNPALPNDSASDRALPNDSDSDRALPNDSVQLGDPVLTRPVSSGEYAHHSILRKKDGPIDEEADALEMPSNFTHTLDRPVKTLRKARFAEAPMSRSRKRRRLLKDADDVLPDVPSSEDEGLNDTALDLDDQDEIHPDGAIVTSDHVPRSQPSEHPTASPSKLPKSSQNARLPFPVVKDPLHPNTQLRLSQNTNPSQKSDSSSSHKGIAPLLTAKTPQKTSSTNLTDSPASALSSAKTTIAPVERLRFVHSHRPGQGGDLLIFAARPPTSDFVSLTLRNQGLPDVVYQPAYYSNEDDVPDQAREYAGREFKLESVTVPYLPDFDPHARSAATFGNKPAALLDHAAEEVKENQKRKRCTFPCWSIADAPPSRVEVEEWLEEEAEAKETFHATDTTSKRPKADLSQIEGPTQKNKHGFKYSQKHGSANIRHETQYMSIMSLEVHVNTRGSLAPNPEEDAVSCIFWCVQADDDDNGIEYDTEQGRIMGVLVVADEPATVKNVTRSLACIVVEEESSELDLLTRLVDIVRFHDPDILTGFEVHNSSWGYLIERARFQYDLNFCDEISRMKAQSHGRFGRDQDKWGFNHTSTVRVTGRHTINIWRAMRSELNLLQYTLENIAFHLLHRRIPHYSFADLTRWYRSKNPRDQARVMAYFMSRVQIDIDILQANELIPRTSEQARLLGVDWFSVISRGSQFKVESLMFRIAKPENMILVSPSRRQVGGQNALECLPLVMEPQSDFYTSPLLVLDFQSLYPSVMIAYNYCYSTFLGRLVSWRGTNKMGFTNYQRTNRLIELLKDHINVAPNGIMYAKPTIRKSLLAKMLAEILETRVMVKSGMKADLDDRALQRLLNNRQLALKMIANVTYGYTSASFSGRMPCAEIADSIVQTGRETLEKAIAYIHSVERWGAEIVYGDTDSLFVHLKGRTREQAFDIGEEIAAAVTNMNPRPVKLKFEKVYHPCVLLAKKRYVGFKYESRTQTKPEFDAKGIETVRRDGTPAEQKIEENALKVLFRTADLSQVKSYFQAQCAKIMRGKVSIQDFCFAREVRLGTYSDKAMVPGALISARRMLQDPRLEPQYGERVPYVVVSGGPQARLIDRCVAPEVLLNDAQSELDAEYYISKNLIPPLERIFNLVGANVRLCSKNSAAPAPD
ncbi:hypothetical protein DV737_g3843, partial [Chaetothyriales sp. CBS 132003]